MVVDPHGFAALAWALAGYACGAPGPGCDLAALSNVGPRLRERPGSAPQARCEPGARLDALDDALHAALACDLGHLLHAKGCGKWDGAMIKRARP